MNTWDKARRTLVEVWQHPANRGQRSRALARAVRYQAVSRIGRPVPARIGTHSAILARRGETNSPRHVYAQPADWPEMLVWPRYLRPGDLFVDVGANVGAYTVLALDAGAQVIAVEPDDGARARLLENVAHNGYACEVVPVAVGAEPGVLSFTTGLDSYNHIALDGDGGREVEVRTLDDILAGRYAEGVKIDVEGFELGVLEGAREALRDHRLGIIQLEWNYRAAQLTGQGRSALADVLDKYGYGLHRPDRHGDLRPVTDPDEGRDVFAVPVKTDDATRHVGTGG